MESISKYLRVKVTPKKVRTERGDLLEYFAKAAGWTIPRMAKKCQGLDLDALYFLKSGFEDRLRRNNKLTAIKWFFWSLNPKKHDDKTTL